MSEILPLAPVPASVDTMSNGVSPRAAALRALTMPSTPSIDATQTALFEATSPPQSNTSTPAKNAKVGERFEAAMLTPLITAILPPADSEVWGGGPGKLWRGLFAEQLAAATAASGGIGIGAIIERAISEARGETNPASASSVEKIRHIIGAAQ